MLLAMPAAARPLQRLFCLAPRGPSDPIPAPLTSPIVSLPLPCYAEEGPLDFTEGSAADAATAQVTADFGQRSLVDVEEVVTYDDEEEEDEVRPEWAGCLSAVKA